MTNTDITSWLKLLYLQTQQKLKLLRNIKYSNFIVSVQLREHKCAFNASKLESKQMISFKPQGHCCIKTQKDETLRCIILTEKAHQNLTEEVQRVHTTS